MSAAFFHSVRMDILIDVAIVAHVRLQRFTVHTEVCGPIVAFSLAESSTLVLLESGKNDMPTLVPITPSYALSERCVKNYIGLFRFRPVRTTDFFFLQFM